MKDKVYGNNLNFFYMLKNVKDLSKERRILILTFLFFVDNTKTLYQVFRVVEFQLTRSIIMKGNKGGYN